MTVVCLHVKPTAQTPGIGLMSVTLLGPRWTGERLRLRHSPRLGLGNGDLVGWSDFYGGGPCQVNVAYASNGQRTGYLVWGGTLGLRVVPPTVNELGRELSDVLEARPLLWIDDDDCLPEEVRRVVEVPIATPARPAGSIIAGHQADAPGRERELVVER